MSNATGARNTIIMPVAVEVNTKGSMKLQLLMQKEDHHHKKQKNEDHTKFFSISSLSGIVPTTTDTWLIDSGASRHMMGYKENLSEVVVKDSHL